MAPHFGVISSRDQLAFQESTTDPLNHVRARYRQIHRGVPVFSGVLQLHFDSQDALVLANGRIYPIPESLSTSPRLSPREAEVVAIEMMGDGSPKAESNELVVVDPGWYGDQPVGARLAYHVILADETKRAEEAFFIDAENGDILDRWSLLCTALDRRVYDAFGLTQLPGGLIRSEGQVSNGDPEIDRLYDYSGDVYEYFQRGFGRDSYDGLGSPIIATAYYNTQNCQNFPNAGWSFVFRQMFFCPGLTVDDVIAHEFTHGVTQYSANLIYQNQPGQLNESFSDIFGELTDMFNSDSAFAGSSGPTPWTPHPSGTGIDAPNGLRSNVCSYSNEGYANGVRWLIAEDSDIFTSGLRDMWNPSCLQHPDRASLLTAQPCILVDNGGVHSGSGVLNHAFAIACDGKSFNGQTVSGLVPSRPEPSGTAPNNLSDGRLGF
ncbi:MAG: M4 family metallopeptidase [Planctomycetes bacterium]|nr:M4 family metallopeptidase [Planctomycetota bacterium]